MITVTISNEALTDLLTNGIGTKNILQKGIPPNCNLKNVRYDYMTGVISLEFNDNKTLHTHVCLEYTTGVSFSKVIEQIENLVKPKRIELLVDGKLLGETSDEEYLEGK